MAIAMALVVFIRFAPTYYPKAYFDTPPINTVRWHMVSCSQCESFGCSGAIVALLQKRCHAPAKFGEVGEVSLAPEEFIAELLFQLLMARVSEGYATLHSSAARVKPPTRLPCSLTIWTSSNFVAIVFQRRQEAHLLCNVEAEAPEIDNVSALTQCLGAFDQSWFEAVLLEPVRYRWSRNACAAYENFRVFQLSSRERQLAYMGRFGHRLICKIPGQHHREGGSGYP